MSLEHRGDCVPVPPEDQILDRLARTNAARTKHRDAFPALSAHTVIGDPIRPLLTELGAKLL
jgi:hypothetical protein